MPVDYNGNCSPIKTDIFNRVEICKLKKTQDIYPESMLILWILALEKQ